MPSTELRARGKVMAQFAAYVGASVRHFVGRCNTVGEAVELADRRGRHVPAEVRLFPNDNGVGARPVAARSFEGSWFIDPSFKEPRATKRKTASKRTTAKKRRVRKPAKRA